MRKIIHIDMDAFYASVEERDFPEYRGKPLVVGGRPDGRGVVATANYEARKYGIRSAMPSAKAFQLCPHAIFVYPRFEAYTAVSKHIREIFYRYTDLVEPLSLDEAYLDITEDKKNIGSAIDIAKEIKQAIKDELNLTASAGISTNKFVAKIASDMNKPDGLTFIGPSRIEGFMEKLPVEKFYGVGKVTASRMQAMQLYTGGDLKRLSEQQMTHHFGKSGRFYYNVIRGVDNRPVRPHRETKSVSSEDTLAEDTGDLVALRAVLEDLCESVSRRLVKYQLSGKTITLKVKFSDFRIVTRSFSLPHPFNDAETLQEQGLRILAGVDLRDKQVRLIGIGLSNFEMPVLITNDQRRQLRLAL